LPVPTNSGAVRLTAAELDTVLDSGEITRARAAWFVLAAADTLPGGPDAEPARSQAAFDAARERGWLPARLDVDSPARLGEVSLLIMKSFGLKGGLMYRLFPNPRYASRELVHLRIIQGRTDPGGRLSGGQFLHILGNTLTFTGEDEALAAEEARRRLLEDVSGSLRDAAKQTEGLSTGTEDILDYEGEFHLE
jgi:hypothetical protein